MLPNRTLEHTTIKDLEKQDITLLAGNDTVVQWIYPDSGEVWPKIQQEKMPLGHGDVLAFVHSFLRDNRLVEDVIYPWYQQKKEIENVFSTDGNTTTASATNLTAESDRGHDVFDSPIKVLSAAFHLRVGDLVLEASESYWRNVLTATRDIAELEHGPGHTVHIYWVYFRANFGGSSGARMRESLSHNVAGEWPSEPRMLPKSQQNYVRSLTA